jgi:hypothetical protein
MGKFRQPTKSKITDKIKSGSHSLNPGMELFVMKILF